MSTFMSSRLLPVSARICVSPTAPSSPPGVTASSRPALSRNTRPSSVSGSTSASRAAASMRGASGRSALRSPARRRGEPVEQVAGAGGGPARELVRALRVPREGVGRPSARRREAARRSPRRSACRLRTARWRSSGDRRQHGDGHHCQARRGDAVRFDRIPPRLAERRPGHRLGRVRAIVAAAGRLRQRPSVVTAVVAAAARALDLGRDPAPVAAMGHDLDVAQAAVQRAEAREALEARVAVDLDAERPPLGVVDRNVLRRGPRSGWCPRTRPPRRRPARRGRGW